MSRPDLIAFATGSVATRLAPSTRSAMPHPGRASLSRARAAPAASGTGLNVDAREGLLVAGISRLMASDRLVLVAPSTRQGLPARLRRYMRDIVDSILSSHATRRRATAGPRCPR